MKKRIYLILKFAECHQINIVHADINEYRFCHNTNCQRCVLLKEDCSYGIISVNDYNYIQNNHPEYLI